jgi:hypothetical protein
MYWDPSQALVTSICYNAVVVTAPSKLLHAACGGHVDGAQPNMTTHYGAASKGMGLKV